MSLPQTLGEVINAAIRQGSAALHVSMPGRIKAYNATEQTADVEPLLKFDRTLDDDTQVAEPLPVLHKVPVQFPGAGGYALTFPVAVGDPCLLVFADRSLDAWYAQGGVVDPLDSRQHDLSDAVALLGVRSSKDALSAAPTDRTVLGQPAGMRVEVGPGNLIDLGGGSSDFVALASKVDAMAGVFNSHVHPGVTTGPGSSGATVTPMGTSSGSTKVKVSG